MGLFLIALPKLQATEVTTAYLYRPEVQQFIHYMVKTHAFEKSFLEAAFQKVRMDVVTLEHIQKPKETWPWHAYRALFITQKRVAEGVAFWKQHQKALLAAEQRYGVPSTIIAAIIGIESHYGQKKGDHRVLDALVTLSFDYPPRAAFFKQELIHYLLLSRTSPVISQTVTGSYAGAIGIPQFMPSSYQRFAVVAHSKGYSDLVNNVEDAIVSIAHYLKQHGWQKESPLAVPAQIKAQIPLDTRLPDRKAMQGSRTLEAWQAHRVYPKATSPLAPSLSASLLELQGKKQSEYWLTFHNFQVLKTYNRSSLYAMVVIQLSELLQ